MSEVNTAVSFKTPTNHGSVIKLPKHKSLNSNQVEVILPKNGADRKIGFDQYLGLCKRYFNYDGFDPEEEMVLDPYILFNFADGEFQLLLCRDADKKIQQAKPVSNDASVICYKVPGVIGSLESLAIRSSSIESEVHETFGESDLSHVNMWLKPPYVVVQMCSK